jgi:hypothetical protein
VSLNGDDMPSSAGSSGIIVPEVILPTASATAELFFGGGGGKLKPNHRQTRSLDETTPSPGQSNGNANALQPIVKVIPLSTGQRNDMQTLFCRYLR